MRIRVSNNVILEEEELQFKYVRSRGPGGQHVNKASTAVQLTFDVANSKSLSLHARRRIKDVVGSQLTKDGLLIIFADRYRSQLRNRKDAVERLQAVLTEALRPVARRVRTKRTYSSVRRRLEAKKRNSARKKDRGWKPGDDS